MRDFVSEKEVDGSIYRAWRSALNPKQTFVELDGRVVEANLREVWTNEAALKALFN